MAPCSSSKKDLCGGLTCVQETQGSAAPLAEAALGGLPRLQEEQYKKCCPIQEAALGGLAEALWQAHPSLSSPNHGAPAWPILGQLAVLCSQPPFPPSSSKPKFLALCAHASWAWHHSSAGPGASLQSLGAVCALLQGIGLALSLHAPNQDLRIQIVPSAKAYHIDKLIEVRALTLPCPVLGKRKRGPQGHFLPLGKSW